MRSIYQYSIIYTVYNIGYFRSRTRSHFFDFLHRVLLVSRIDTFGRITGKKIFIKFQTRHALYNGKTLFFGHTWINCRFVNYNVAFRNDLPYSFTGTPKRLQIRAIVIVNRSRNCYHIEITIANILQISCTLETIGNSILK